MSETLSPQEQKDKLKAEYEQRIAEIERQMQVEGSTQNPEVSVDQKREAIERVVTEQLGTAPVTEAPVDANADPDIAARVQQYIEMASHKGPYKAAVEVNKQNNPALTDAFHRALTTELYDQFVQQGKLEKVA